MDSTTHTALLQDVQATTPVVHSRATAMGVKYTRRDRHLFVTYTDTEEDTRANARLVLAIGRRLQTYLNTHVETRTSLHTSRDGSDITRQAVNTSPPTTCTEESAALEPFGFGDLCNAGKRKRCATHFSGVHTPEDTRRSSNPVSARGCIVPAFGTSETKNHHPLQTRVQTRVGSHSRLY